MKKKIVALCLVACLAVIAVAGASLAYFTSEDSADNVFSMNGVEIKLEEEFEQNSILYPGAKVNKDVYVTNIGTAPAYTRVHIAIPTALDDGDPNFDASQNFLHFNFTKASYADGQWSWLPEFSEGAGYKGNGAGNWNFYQTEIDGVDYNVYVVTYRTALEAGAKTATQALDQVYLDTTVDCVINRNDNGEIVSYTYADNKGNDVTLTVEEAKNVTIKVFAEATQTEPFDNAYDALNAAFGTPGSANYVSPWDKPAA